VTDNTPDTPATGLPGGQAEIIARMRAIAAGLQASGLDARVHETRGVLDITATAYRPGTKNIEVICDEDGYVQAAWWNDPGATPGEVTAVISLVLAAITGPS
jgi:hypothetical protein